MLKILGEHARPGRVLPFADDASTSRETAFAKIRARVQGNEQRSRSLPPPPAPPGAEENGRCTLFAMHRTLRLWTLVTALGTGIASIGCGHGVESGGAREVNLTSARVKRDSELKGAPISQAELQESLQRFTGVFLDRISQAMSELARTSAPEASDATLRGNLLYSSSALDITSGPLPEVNLLDMIVFLRLCRESFEAHWMPELYGERGRVVLEVFRTSEEDLGRIASRVMTPAQRTELDVFIERWRQDNPKQFRVEGVRMMDFSQRAGQVELSRAEETGGLLASVRGATQAADQALLIAERGMFLAQRVPFLLRLQARIGSREIVSDTLSTVGSPAQLMSQLQGFEPMVRQLPVLAERSGQAAHEARLLVQDVQPLIPSRDVAEKITETIAKTNELTLNTRQMLQDMKALVPSDANNTVATAKRGVDDALKRAFLYLVLLGGTWSALWWGGFYVSKRRLARRA